MANKILLTEMDGTPKQIVFADHANDFSPTAANDLRLSTSGNREDVEMQLASVADTAGRQSDKADLGTDRAMTYQVTAAIEFASSGLTAGEVVEFYWAPSFSSTAATANPGGVSGSNSAYAGYSSNLIDSVKQLDFIGYMSVTGQATTTVQIASIGILAPAERYGTLVVKNESGASLHSDDVEMHVVFDPIVNEIQ